ncbi:histidine phosphatase superfamily [Aspergillus pseudoustus]|uniref:Histidine phosphatase superfamily n=1 Tax=Aspergillus pseudoustus TaxID=1810923 RepID=A0ABR4KFS2_9EURO
MSDRESLTPRVFLVRHGETEWAKSGRFTGTTEIGLTATGAQQVSSAAATLIGPGRLIDPSRVVRVIVSPRRRAAKTCEILLKDFSSRPTRIWDDVTYTEDIAEWDYGDYEGCTDQEIRNLRKKKGLDLEKEWYIWRDGCEGGESSKQVTERLDRLISQIKDIQRPYMNGEASADVLIVAHGLINRCFVKRWLGFAVDFDLPMIFAPGAVAVLSYKNNDIDKPALHVGVALPLSSDEDSVRGAEQ